MFFFGRDAPARKRRILDKFGIQEGTLQHTYPGIPMFKGMVIRDHMQSVIEAIKGRIDN